MKPLLTAGMVIASVVPSPALAEESRTLEEKLLHCELVMQLVAAGEAWDADALFL